MAKNIKNEKNKLAPNSKLNLFSGRLYKKPEWGGGDLGCRKMLENPTLSLLKKMEGGWGVSVNWMVYHLEQKLQKGDFFWRFC